MKFQLSKSGIAIALSRLRVFEKPKLMEEQYPTDSEIAAEILWFSHMSGEISGRTVADLGCGTGILGIGALLLGAQKVFFVDSDMSALELTRKNIQFLEHETGLSLSDKAEIVNNDISEFNDKVNLVIENPPFGTKLAHADKLFLEKAFKIAPVIYSIHKAESKNFIESIAKESSFKITHYFEFDMPIRAT
ncbi:MAG: METTL5 family protein, partial [Candidatus Woesearchaeota archaeon]|nr:METTL5 family protein [Candidatus Woesearchaeota archaeon]